MMRVRKYITVCITLLSVYLFYFLALHLKYYPLLNSVTKLFHDRGIYAINQLNHNLAPRTDIIDIAFCSNNLKLFRRTKDIRINLNHNLIENILYKIYNKHYNSDGTQNLCYINAEITKNGVKSTIPTMLFKAPFKSIHNANISHILIYFDISKLVYELNLVILFVCTGIIIITLSIMLPLLYSSKKRQVLEMQEGSKELSFLSNLTHELKTPLNAIIGFSELIRDASVGSINKHYRGYAQDIYTSGILLLDLVNDILDLSKIEAKKLHIREEYVDITRLCKSSLKVIEKDAKNNDIILVEEKPEKHSIILGDSVRLKQVLINLLSNAVKFTKKGGKIYMKAAINKSILKVSVEDTGIGMSNTEIKEALLPFTQIPNGLNKHGTGLGLPLAHKLTEAMGGNFNIKSKKGEGTIVTLTFRVTQITD